MKLIAIIHILHWLQPSSIHLLFDRAAYLPNVELAVAISFK